MRIIVGVLGISVGVLSAVVGAILCYLTLFAEQVDWPTVSIGVVLLLVGVGCIWTELNRATRG